LAAGADVLGYALQQRDGAARMHYFWIGVGSALGGMARFWLSGVSARLFGEALPWGTLLVNVSGSLLIGLFATLSGPGGRLDVDPSMRLFVMVGLCGGYTTFSAFSLQTLTLMQEGAWGLATIYIAASLVLCVLGVLVGHLLAVQWSV
jgi:CrcB protein